MDTGSVNIFTKVECLKIIQNSLKLSNDSSVRLRSYCVKRGSSELLGFMGEYYKLQITLEDEQVLNYFVKTVPLTNETHRDECERKWFFPKETRIYDEILTNIQKYANIKLYPKCYYTRQDLMVLEDLSQTPEGYRQLTDKESYTMEHIQVMLRHLAKLHAASIAWELDEDINIGEKFKNILIEMQLSMNNEWYETGVKGILFLAKRHAKFQSQPHIKKFIDERLHDILCNAEVLTMPSSKYRNVLCHRDSWDRNIFYQFNASGQPISCRIVDFQLTRYSPPGIDVLFFLYVNTTPEYRERIYEQSLDYYHEMLMAAFRDLHIHENTITKEDFLAECRRSRLAVLILWAICEPLMKMPKGLANKWRAEEQETFDKYMNYQRDELFVRVIKLEPTYEDVIMRPIEDLIEYLLRNTDLY